MTTNRFAKSITATVGLAAFTLAANAGTEAKGDTVKPPTWAVIAVTVTYPAHPATAAFLPAASASPNHGVVRWVDLKEFDFSQRDRLFAELGRLEALVDAQIGQLQVRRDTITGSIDPMAWDFAMKELVDARTFLRVSAQELRGSTPEMWSRLKAKVGLGLTRTQTACDRVRASATPV